MKSKLLILFIVLGGCATPVTMEATGGSRSDGTVELSYNYNELESPVVDPGQALATAREKCGAWGYKDAEAFGEGVSQCSHYNGNGNCIAHIVTVTYQCIGSPSSGS